MKTKTPQPASADGKAAREALRSVFGIRALRPGQRDVIDRVLAGRSTLAVMPTGAGKSLCYQLPALLLQGMTVVVSPLIALMKDQCEKLCAQGVAAVQLNSHCTAEETHRAEAAIATGAARIVLTTPERLAQPEFMALLTQQPVALLVVDEAHCIAQWGHDFRPAFLDIEPAIQSLGGPTVLALTATASEDVVREVMKRLGIPADGCVDTGAYRPNLHYAVEQLEDDADRDRRVLAIAAETAGSGIVYTATVSKAQAVHALLSDAGQSVGLYHGRRSATERRDAQDAFMRGDLRIMVATNAFGMGIDKPDIRFVLHDQMPSGLDAYYQESGRAGRDGQDAACVLLFLPRDKAIQQFFMAGRYPDLRELDAVHGALTGRGGEHDAHTAWTPAELAQKLDMPRNKVQVVLDVLRQHKGVRRDSAGAFAATGARVDGPALERMLKSYREKRERDRAVLEGMVAYAQSGRCRWQVLLAHLEEAAPVERCGHCDNCRRIAAHEARMAEPIVLTESPPTPTPEIAFATGDAVKVKRYGPGKVVGADALSVTIEFGDGSRRCFHPSFVRAGRAPRAASVAVSRAPA